MYGQQHSSPNPGVSVSPAVSNIQGSSYGPRHSSPDPQFSFNSPRPPNVGPILGPHPTIPPPNVGVGPHMRLFAPPAASVPRVPVTALPWGSGVIQGFPRPVVPATVIPQIFQPQTRGILPNPAQYPVGPTLNQTDFSNPNTNPEVSKALNQDMMVDRKQSQSEQHTGDQEIRRRRKKSRWDGNNERLDQESGRDEVILNDGKNDSRGSEERLRGGATLRDDRISGRQSQERGRSEALLRDQRYYGRGSQERGKGGAILRDDRSDSRQRQERGRGGAILKDDRNDSRQSQERGRGGAILKDDRYDGRLNQDSRRGGAILRDDRNNGRQSQERGRNWAILKDDRNDTRQSQERGRGGAILKDDRHDSRQSAERGRGGAVLKNDRYESRQSQERGRGGAILRDDRNNGRRSQERGRGGALFKDDKYGGNRSERLGSCQDYGNRNNRTKRDGNRDNPNDKEEHSRKRRNSESSRCNSDERGRNKFSEEKEQKSFFSGENRERLYSGDNNERRRDLGYRERSCNHRDIEQFGYDKSHDKYDETRDRQNRLYDDRMRSDSRERYSSDRMDNFYDEAEEGEIYDEDGRGLEYDRHGSSQKGRSQDYDSPCSQQTDRDQDYNTWAADTKRREKEYGRHDSNSNWRDNEYDRHSGRGSDGDRRSDWEASQHRPIHRDDKVGERGQRGAVLIDDREKPARSKKVSERGTILIQDRDDETIGGDGGHVQGNDNYRRRGSDQRERVLDSDRHGSYRKGRTGAVLLDDREEERPIHREDRGVSIQKGVSVAKLIEDRQRSDHRGQSRSHRGYSSNNRGDRGQSHSSKGHYSAQRGLDERNSEGHRSSKDDYQDGNGSVAKGNRDQGDSKFSSYDGVTKGYRGHRTCRNDERQSVAKDERHPTTRKDGEHSIANGGQRDSQRGEGCSVVKGDRGHRDSHRGEGHKSIQGDRDQRGSQRSESQSIANVDRGHRDSYRSEGHTVHKGDRGHRDSKRGEGHALAKNDRGHKDSRRGQGHSVDRGHRESQRSEGNKGLGGSERDLMLDSDMDRFSRGRSQDRGERSLSSQRSFSGSGKRSRSDLDEESRLSEPGRFKRKRVEDETDDPSLQCVRSGTPIIPDDESSTMDVESVAAWVRCSAADLYFKKDPKTGNLETTKRMKDLEKKFEHDLVQRAKRVKDTQIPYVKPIRKPKLNFKHKCKHHESSQCTKHSSSDTDSDSDSDTDSEEEDWWLEEVRHKRENPYRLHSELWYNEPGELNYGPLCRCSAKSRKFGIRHDIYPGEKPLPKCAGDGNNLEKLYHYKITVSPVTNFLTKHPTIINFDGHEYMFEGFSVFSHKPIPKLPACQVIRFNIIYTIHIIEEQAPENFSVDSLDLFARFMFDEILELYDIDWKGPGGDEHCRRFHIMPRFARPFPENGKEVLSMNDVFLYLLKSSKPVIEQSDLASLIQLDHDSFQHFVDGFRHMVVTCPGKRPSSIRIDQLDKQNCETADRLMYPLIIHHGNRPPQLSYAGDNTYRKKWKEYLKFRHLLWSRTKVTPKDKDKLEEFEAELHKIRSKCSMKKEVTVEVSSEGFLLTGIRSDMCQHAMMLPVLFNHVRFHECLTELESRISYQFKDRSLIQLALTHASYKVNYGTNPDHGRNSMCNCGSRHLQMGDVKIHHQHTRKRGLNVLLKIMAKMAKKQEQRSEIPHNERLEFLGDAVVEFITSIHLFYMFPHADEGELTTYRGALVQNAHFAVLAEKLGLHEYLLYAHGPDLCHDGDLKHAMANCFEAVMGALYLDGGIEVADRVFTSALFTEEDLLDIWKNIPKHQLQIEEPNGDRHWIEKSPALKKMVRFENDIGYEFYNIRLLAKAFTQRSVGYNRLTHGHNQRLEFLGDTVMQLISSNYLFRHFPDHHEGHLTLLRSSLVNNKTQARVSEELGMTAYVLRGRNDEASLSNLKQKEKADLLESVLGAIYVDGGIEPCTTLCNVCFFPRLDLFIMNQDWNDPKSQLQQSCLTLRDTNEEYPDIPIYKVLSQSGPTNTRTFKVAVYFRGKRLAVGDGKSIQQGEMKAAETALNNYKGMFNVKLRARMGLK